MSFISALARLYKNLRDALRLAHKACRLAARINAEVQASNASDGIKTLSTNWLASTNALCDAIQEYKDSLPGE